MVSRKGEMMSDEVIEGAIVRIEETPRDLSTDLRRWAVATARTPGEDNLEQREREIERFLAWVGKPPELVSPADVDAWRVEMQGLSKATVNKRLSHLSSYFAHLARDGRITANPVAFVKRSRVKAYGQVRPLTDDEVTAMTEAIKAEPNAVIRARDLAIFSLFLYYGLRRREVCGLRWEDAELRKQQPEIRITAKGGEERVIRLAAEDRELILYYLEISRRHGRLKRTDGLFAASRGGSGKPISSWTIDQRFKRYAETAGIDDFHLHQLRHTYAAKVYEQDKDIREVQKLLGHKQIGTTAIYIERLEPARADRAAKKLRRAWG